MKRKRESKKSLSSDGYFVEEKQRDPKRHHKKGKKMHKSVPMIVSSDSSDTDTEEETTSERTSDYIKHLDTNPFISGANTSSREDDMRLMADLVSNFDDAGETLDEALLNSADSDSDDTQPPTPQQEPITINWSSDEEEVVPMEAATPPPPKKKKKDKSRMLPATVAVTAKPPTCSTHPTEDKMTQSLNLTKYMREGFKIKVFSHGIRAFLWCVIRDYLQDHYVDDFETWYANLERDKAIKFYSQFDHVLKDGIKRLHAKCKLPADVVESAKKMKKGTYTTIQNLIKFSPSMDWFKFALSNNGGKMHPVDYYTLVEIHDSVIHT